MPQISNILLHLLGKIGGMRMQTICLVLVIVLVCPFAPAQWVQTNGPHGGLAMAFAFSGKHMFVGIRSGGVYHSTDNGITWTPASSGLTNMYMYALLFDGTNLFAGTEEGGVFLSTDYGAHWTAVNTGLTDPYAFALAVSGPNLFAGTNGGVFLSTNNGTRWTAASAGLTNPHVYALAVSGTNVFAGTLGGVFLSTNNGTSWIAVNSGLTNPSVHALMVVGTNLFAATRGGGIFRSTNNGTDWTAVNSGLLNGDVLTMGSDSTTLIAGTFGNGIFRSTDNGTNWIPSGLNRYFVWAAAITGTNLFAGTSGGVFRSSDNGTSWREADSMIVNSYVVALTSKGTDLFASAEGNGVARSTDSGNSWTPLNSGKSSTVVTCLAVSGDDLFAGSYGYGGVYMSANNGESWTIVNTGLTNSLVLALLVNGMDLFAGTMDGGVFRTTNNGTNWTLANSGLPNSPINALATNGTSIFAGTLGDGVFRSTDNGESWIAANSGISNMNVQAFGVSGTNLFAGTVNGLFRSTDNGKTWSAANAGLADRYVLAFAAGGGNIFAGTAGKVALSTDNGTTWVPVDAGLTRSWVRSLAISGAYLCAGAGAGGVWRRRLSEMLPLTPSSPTLSSPSNRATGVPTILTLVWMRFPGATSYRLEVATDSNLASGVVFSDSTLTDTSQVVYGLLNGTKYYWRVAGKNVDGTGPWSAVWRFMTIVSIPGAVTLVSPADNASGRADSMKCIWRSTTPASSTYWFEIAHDSVFTFKFVDSTVSDSTYVVRGLPSGTTFWWRVKGYNAAGWGAFREVRKFMVNYTSINSLAGIPVEFSLSQNHPNPFNPSTTIRYGLPARSRVALAVFNTLGQQVEQLVNGDIEAGYHEVKFDGSGLSSGVYFYRIEAGSFVQTRKLLLIR
jgi:photosystem II stability/assembly factor-like uncharacterized protein